MNGGVGRDGKDDYGNFIDCTKTANRNEAPTSVCLGFSIGSTNDASGLGVMRYTGRGMGGVLPTIARYRLGEIHYFSLEKIYPSDANGVILYFA
jgi:hypothetical protein